MQLRIKALRKSQNLNQDDLAALTGIPQYTISRLETGALRPRLELLHSIALALHVKIDDLYELTEEPSHA